MKVPPKRKGNPEPLPPPPMVLSGASMNVPPKRKGNSADETGSLVAARLNESPSEKEGKFGTPVLIKFYIFRPQ